MQYHDYRGLNAITRPAVEPLPHIDALLDGTRGSRLGDSTALIRRAACIGVLTAHPRYDAAGLTDGL